MTRMQNDELRRQIGRAQDQLADTKEKRVRATFEIDQVYNDLFVKNDTMKLYDRTIEDLKKAIDVEKQFMSQLQAQIKEMKVIVAEE